MAWEEFERNGIKGISGDIPIDEFSMVLKRVAVAYEDRFSRKPTVAELLYALETTLTTHATRYVSDAEGLKLGEIILNRNYESDDGYINKDQYEGVYTEATLPSYYVVLRRSSNGQNQTNMEVVKIPTLEVKDRTLVCEYEIMADDITEKMAESLILSVLLADYCDHYYEVQAEEIEFINIKSYARRKVPYGLKS